MSNIFNENALGYQPDGNGMTYKGNWVDPGALHPVDDDLLIWLTKALIKK